jgi:hypothetical protein
MVVMIPTEQAKGKRAFGKWIADALRSAGIRQADLSRLLSEKLGRTVDRSALNKMIKDRRTLMADELLAISELTGFAPPGLATPAKPDVPHRDGFDPEVLAELLAAAFQAAKTVELDGRRAKNLALALLEAARTPQDQEEAQEVQDVNTRLAVALTRVFARPQP